jgi:hypothetical protein
VVQCEPETVATRREEIAVVGVGLVRERERELPRFDAEHLCDARGIISG